MKKSIKKSKISVKPKKVYPPRKTDKPTPGQKYTHSVFRIKKGINWAVPMYQQSGVLEVFLYGNEKHPDHVQVVTTSDLDPTTLPETMKKVSGGKMVIEFLNKSERRYKAYVPVLKKTDDFDGDNGYDIDDSEEVDL